MVAIFGICCGVIEFVVNGKEIESIRNTFIWLCLRLENLSKLSWITLGTNRARIIFKVSAVFMEKPLKCPSRNADRTGEDVVSRHELRSCHYWQNAFAAQHKDHRYYDLIDETIHPEFQYLYFVLRDSHGLVLAIQPFFIVEQDILAGVRPYVARALDVVRHLWPGFMFIKAMMVGCVAGEAHLDDGDEIERAANAELLAIEEHARELGAPLIVLKEFPASYRKILSCFEQRGFTRIPSYSSFDEYMRLALKSATRSKLRKKFKATEDVQIELHVSTDVTPIIDELYPLYLNVYQRSKLHFEKLTKDYFCRLGQMMPDRTRFFVWRYRGKAVAFGERIVHSDTMYAEYLGLDYSVALRLHLYHYVFRDLVKWGIENGYKSFQSGGLNYDPKLHLRYRLKPVDLYVKHTSTLVNFAMRVALPWLEPTRYDPTLSKFSNYHELWTPPLPTGKRNSEAPR